MVLEGNHLHIKAHLAFFFADAFSWKEIVHFDHSLSKISNDDIIGYTDLMLSKIVS